MKKRTGDPWMPAPAYGRSLVGLGVNLMVEDVARATRAVRGRDQSFEVEQVRVE